MSTNRWLLALGFVVGSLPVFSRQAVARAGEASPPVLYDPTASSQKPSLALVSPSPAQVDALHLLQQAVTHYEAEVLDYQEMITNEVQLHYEKKKREILSTLDGEIALERDKLRQAQEDAIARMEEFVARYSGRRAHPKATPDAMYRLAALYEERVRNDEFADLEVALLPAIRLYKRIIREFPDYREIGGVYYFLGHAYNDSGRVGEAQQVWRSFVCRNHYVYPTATDPNNPDVDLINPLPQDKPEADWIAWRKRYQTPESLNRSDPDNVFVDPYPADCVSLVQGLEEASHGNRYSAEIWWQIGNWHFDQFDRGGGRILNPEEPDFVALPAVYGYNRAESAYRHSLQLAKAPLFGVALYKEAWTLFKQQRYEAATRAFVELLLYTDQQEKETGDPGADFRAEAYAYIAGSLTNADFVGPDPSEPFIPRLDVVEVETNPAIAEQKLRQALARIADPTLIPQDKPWSIELYKALALEYRELSYFASAVEIYDMILSKWPLSTIAPEIQHAIAETYDLLGEMSPPGSPGQVAASAKALEARTALARYIGKTPWVEAHKDDSVLLQNTERMVRTGVQQAAIQHTNNGRAAFAQAGESSDPRFVAEQLQFAMQEYALASDAWGSLLQQDDSARDNYETRYWLADARLHGVRTQLLLHQLNPEKFEEPTQASIELAKQTAIQVRDSNEDDKFFDNAALWVVTLTDIRRDMEYLRYTLSNGTQGVAQRQSLELAGESENKQVVRVPVPQAVLDSIAARDDYVRRAPATKDGHETALTFQYYAGETFFLYGQLEEARTRFEAMYRDHCGQDEFGYKAWEKLITMSNLSGDAARSYMLAEAEKKKSCAMNEKQRAQAALIVDPTLQEASFARARDEFNLARDMTPGPEQDKRWHSAASLYEAALLASPARDEAPEAAMNAAFAYKQVGDFQKAIELYQKFLQEYGNNARLTALEKGDPAQNELPNLKKYQERLHYLNEAYDALSTTYFSFFNYQRTAETYEQIANNNRFVEEKRRGAARNALILYAKMGQRASMDKMYALFSKLNPGEQEKADASYLVANYDYQQWNAQGADTGANRTTRLAAEESLIAFYDKHAHRPSAGKYALEAAYKISRLKKAVQHEGYPFWLQVTIKSWEELRRYNTLGADNKPEAMSPPYADYAAEAEYTLIDHELREKYDYDTGHHRYAGTVEDILGKYNVDKAGNATLVKKGRYQLDAEDADKYDQQLSHIADTYPSLEWVPVAIARKGSLYDSLRAGLYNAVPPALVYFTKQQEALLKQLEDSGRDELIEQADELRSRVKEGWRDRRDRELAASDEVMIRNYATALSLAQQYNTKSPVLQKALAQMAFYTDILGDVRMKTFVEKTRNPNKKDTMLSYTDGMYMRMRSGILVVPETSGQLSPTPTQHPETPDTSKGSTPTQSNEEANKPTPPQGEATSSRLPPQGENGQTGEEKTPPVLGVGGGNGK